MKQLKNLIFVDEGGVKLLANTPEIQSLNLAISLWVVYDKCVLNVCLGAVLVHNPEILIGLTYFGSYSFNHHYYYN